MESRRQSVCDRRLDEKALTGITFKVSEINYEILRDRPGCRPAPYLASRGMKWIQHYAKPGLADKDLKYYIQQSYRIVAGGSTTALNAEMRQALNQQQ